MATLVSTQVYSEVAVDPFEQALFVDLKIEAQKEGLRIRYSSRSTFRGLFGFGWCSPLDGRVVIRRSNGREQLFYYGCDQRSGGHWIRGRLVRVSVVVGWSTAE